MLSLRPDDASLRSYGGAVHGVTQDATRVYFNDGFGRIWGARKDGTEIPFEVLAGAAEERPNPANNVHAIDLIVQGDDVVFTASAQGVMAVAKGGGEPRMLTQGKQDPVTVVSDGSSLFFTVFGAGPLRRIPRAGGEAKAVFADGSHVSIAIDERNLYLAHYRKGSILRIPKDGGPSRILSTSLPRPVGIAIDATYVYFPCEGDGSVRRVPKEGGKTEIIATKQNNHDLLAVDETHVYWSSWEENAPLRRVRKDGSEAPETLLRGLKSPAGIAVDEKNVYVANKGHTEVLVVPKSTRNAQVTYPEK